MSAVEKILAFAVLTRLTEVWLPRHRNIDGARKNSVPASSADMFTSSTSSSVSPPFEGLHQDQLADATEFIGNFLPLNVFDVLDVRLGQDTVRA